MSANTGRHFRGERRGWLGSIPLLCSIHAANGPGRLLRKKSRSSPECAQCFLVFALLMLSISNAPFLNDGCPSTSCCRKTPACCGCFGAVEGVERIDFDIAKPGQLGVIPGRRRSAPRRPWQADSWSEMMASLGPAVLGLLLVRHRCLPITCAGSSHVLAWQGTSHKSPAPLE